MSTFEFVVPLMGFVVAGVGIWFLRREAAQIDRRVRARRQHPAE